ncbi:MAG: hypothetical protein JSW18_03560 [Candidatus Omnitrophota bacterium]|nr:MAG: hypothetical protein JSW18_03560 [Candidatus Omnitrophota bacterium]
MKSLIIYYSYTGNTGKVAEILKGILSQKGQAEIHRLKPTDESNNFFVQAAGAFTGKRAKLPEEWLDLSGYDLVCLGTPVWAFAPTPAINTYLDKCRNLDGKDAICFVTYASGAGVKRCVNTMIEKLKQKGAFKISSFNIQQGKVGDAEFVEQGIKEALEMFSV